MITLLCKHEFPPSLKYEGDVGIDLYLPTDAVLTALTPRTLGTGVFVQDMRSVWAQVLPKSSSNDFTCITGVIDQGYRGEIAVKLLPFFDLQLRRGTPVAQLVLHVFKSPMNGVMLNDRFMEPKEQGERDQDGGIWRKARAGG